MCRRVSGSVGPAAAAARVLYWYGGMTAGDQLASCWQLPAAAWQLLSSAPCPPTSCAPAAETDGDQRRQHRGREQRVTYVVIKPSTSLQPASSLHPPVSSLAMFSDFWEEDLYKVSSISIPATSLLAFMALLGISVDRCLEIWQHQKIASNVFWEP